MEKSIYESLQEAYIEDVYNENFHPVYGRGGELKRTETALSALGKHASSRDKKRLHNIPRGGRSITDKDPQGERLGTGEYDRGSGNAAKRRAKGITKSKPNNFGNRLMRKDGHGIKDSYDYSDVILNYLLDEGYVDNEESGLVLLNHMSDEWLDSIIEGSAWLDTDMEWARQNKNGLKTEKEKKKERDEKAYRVWKKKNSSTGKD